MESGFSATTNPNGVWSYGFQSPFGSALTPYTTVVTTAGIFTWCNQSNPDYQGCVNGNPSGSPVDWGGMYWNAGGMTFHPGPQDQKATIRWTAPYAADVYVSASFWGANYGGGSSTDVHVLHNGTELFSGVISGYGGEKYSWFGSSPTQSWGGGVTVAQGDTIDFACGYGNGTYYADLTGVSGWISDTPPGPPIVTINEIQSANSATIADEDGDHSDWIEICNTGGSALNLQDYGLSDDPASPFKWTFPSYSIQPGQYLVVFASDKDRKTGRYFHTNYGIKSSGETISLTAPDGTLVSQTPAVSIPQDMSYGCKPDASSTLLYFAIPTPGAPNTTTGYLGTLPAPVFSRARGFYTSAFNLTITSSVTDGVIRYTTNGSAPTEASPIYTGPIAIPSGAAGSIFKTTSVRARVFKTDYMPSPITTNTYFVGPNSSTRYNLPIVALATDSANLYDPEIGIYVAGNHSNYTQEGDAWERPIHVEFFEPAGTDGFACDAGVRIHGGWTVNFPQKSLRLYADHQGGPGTFGYQIFPNSPITEYQRIVLRNWGNDNEYFSDYWFSTPRVYTLFRDALANSLLWSLDDAEGQYYRPAVVFMNGAYWGLFGIYERQDKEWVANHHPDVDEDNLDIIQQNPNVWEVSEGDTAALSALFSYFQSNDLIVPANYDYVKSKMDVSNVLLNNLAQIYFGNTDWPGNNLRYWRPRTEDGKWRWTLYDLDFSFGLVVSYPHNTLGYASMRGGSWANPDSICVILASLLRNREAHDEFINRMADLLNTVFKPSLVNARIDTMKAELAPYVAEHFTRWGNEGNVTEWNSNVQRLKTMADQRPNYIRNQFVEFFRLSGTSNLTLASSTTNGGSVVLNTVSLPASSLPWQGIYFNDAPIKLTAVPSAGYRFVRWEGAGLGAQNPASVTLAGDTTITAVFEVNQ